MSDTSYDMVEFPPSADDELEQKKQELLALQQAAAQPVNIADLSKAGVVPQELQPGPVAAPVKNLPVAPRPDISPPMVTPEGMALLDTIATREAEPAFKNGERAGWNTMVAGERFDPSTMEHPHIAYPGMRGFVGGAGRSYASGRYQETTNTYYENVARSQKLHPGVEVRGWSPEAQNIRNWDKAQEVYQQHYSRAGIQGLTGNLQTDLENNKDNPEVIGRMARALSAEWTSAPGGHENAKQTGGKESYYGNTFIQMMKTAVAQGDTSKVAAMLNPEPIATQKAPLTGGNAAITAPSTVAMIKDTAQRLNNVDPTARVKHTVETQQPLEALPQPYAQEQTLPMPFLTSGQQALADAAGPSVLSTIMTKMNLPVEPPPQPTAPSELPEAKPSSILDDITSVVQALRPSGWGTGGTGLGVAPYAETATQTARGIGAGIGEIPSGLAESFAGLPLTALGLITGSQGLKQAAAGGMVRAEAERQRMRDLFGVGPQPSTPARVGEVIGQSLSPNVPGTLMNLLGSGFSQLTGPLAHRLGQQFPIPPVIGPAEAATAFGKPPMVINTPAGPVTMNDSQLSEFVYGGVMAMGFGMSPALISKGVRLAREDPIVRVFTDPRREVPGALDNVAASVPADILKAGIVDPAKTLLDIADRHARYNNYQIGAKGGIDPAAADHVYQKYRVQTASGAHNLVNLAVTDGAFSTDNFRFNVPKDSTLAILNNFSQANPDFGHYLKARAIQDQLGFNMQQRMTLPPSKQGRLPQTYDDADNRVWTFNNATQAVDSYHNHPQIGPLFRQAYDRYQANLKETRRFVTDGPTALEDIQQLSPHAATRPSIPIFSVDQDVQKTFARILDNINPLRVAEDSMKSAMLQQMRTDAHLEYIRQVAQPRAFIERDADWMANRGQVAKETGAAIRFRQHGQSVYFTTDPLIASIMNSNDHPIATFGKIASTLKTGFQSTTTGKLSPWFAPTAAHRAMWQGMTTYPQNVYNPAMAPVGPAGYLSTFAAIPRILAPQAAHFLVPTASWFEDRVNHTSLGRVMNPNQVKLISRTLEDAYNRSFYRRMELAGAFQNETLAGSKDKHDAVTQLRLQNQNTPARPMVDWLHRASRIAWAKIKNDPYTVLGLPGMEATRKAVQDSPQFAWAYKAGTTGRGKLFGDQGTPHVMMKDAQGVDVVRPMTDAELAARYRDYTGDPAKRGLVYSEDIRGNPETLRHSFGSNFATMRADAYLGLGKVAHGLRVVTPWAGVLLQSPAKTIEALRANPVRASLYFGASHVLPEMMAYLWNLQQGQQYIDYQFGARDGYKQDNNIYVAMPGQPPEKGIEVPWYQEGILVRAMARAFMNQYYGRSNGSFIYPNNSNAWFGDDLKRATWSMLEGAFVPPPPPLLGAGLAAKGIVLPPGGYLADLYARKSNPFDPKAESPGELILRQWWPAIADVGINAMHAGMDAPENASVWEKLEAAGKQAGQRAISRTAGLRDVIGYKQPVSGTSPVADEAFRKKRIIEDLVRRYETWEQNQGTISLKGFGSSPKADIRGYMGPLPPAVQMLKPQTGGTAKPQKDKMEGRLPNPGLAQNQPMNQLYTMFMDEMKNTFGKDSPDTGGMGYKSMWHDYSIWSQEVKRVWKVNEGNSAAWVKEQEKNNPQGMKWLQEQGVNPRDYREVKDYYNKRRADAAQKILWAIKAAEQKIDKDPTVRQMLGPQRFSVEMLDPNQAGIDVENASEE